MTQDEDDRTTALGLFHYGHSYARAATSLLRLNDKSTHPEAPIRFLFNHSAELFLKAFLRLKGFSVSQLRSRPYGHDLTALTNDAVRHGLALSVENKQVLLMMNDGILDRYISVGTRFVAPIEQTQQLCQSLNSEIGPKIYLYAGLKRNPPDL